VLSVLASLAGGCVRDNLVACGDTSCPAELVCGPQGGCATPTQIAQCEGLADGVECGDAGVCELGICQVARCGDGVVAFQEACEVGVEQTCAEVGGYGAALATCTSECTSELGACPRCGDGVVQTDEELCDGAPTVSCSPAEIGYFECNGCDNVGRCAVIGFAQFELGADVISVWAGSRTELYGLALTQLFRSTGGSFTIEDLRTTLVAVGAPGHTLQVGWGRAGSLWLAGSGGLLLRHDGASWSRITAVGLPDPVPDLLAVHELDASSAIVVGDAGTIVELAGTTATRVAAGLSDQRLRAVSSDGTTAYAVGHGATVLRRDGGGWSVDPAIADLAAIDPPVDLVAVWARGGRVIALDSTGLVYERASVAGVPTWVGRPDQTPAALRTLWGTAATDLFAVGYDAPTSSDQLFHFDGDAWAMIDRTVTDPPPTGAGASIPGSGQLFARAYGLSTMDAAWARYRPEVTAVYAIGDDLWRVHQRRLYRNGEFMFSAEAPIQHVFGAGDGIVYLLINVQISPPTTIPPVIQGRVYRYDGVQRTLLSADTEHSGFRGFVAGSRVLVITFLGGLIEVTSSGLVQISSALTWGSVLGGWGNTGDNVFVVGAEGIRHWDGSTWSQPDPVAGGGYYAIWGDAAGSVHAVGDHAAVFDGTSWTRLMADPFVGTLYGIDGMRATDLYAISTGIGGTTGVVRHYDGRAWRDISALASSGPVDGFQVAARPSRITFTTQSGVRGLVTSRR